MRAEIIAIGDELTCGYRLDTNSQWISEQLTETGVNVSFHTTVGDELDEIVDALQTAARRVEIVLLTGGLGPTDDDLTRQAVALMGNRELEFDASSLAHIRQIFERRGREMPERNRRQACFPAGSRIIPNAEGTAPGFDLELPSTGGRSVRIFALPGVPYEMKEMWAGVVAGEIASYSGNPSVICHHVLHCFGAGESRIESMLPDLVTRDRIPRVGITASKATISLRVTAQAVSRQACAEQMAPTLRTIRECLGDLVFGENGQQLQEVVVSLLERQSLSLAIVDLGLRGSVARLMNQVDRLGRSMVGSVQMPMHQVNRWLGEEVGSSFLEKCAERVRREFEADWGIAIGPIEEDGEPRFDLVIRDSLSTDHHALDFAGHSRIRWDRAEKQVLNQIRLKLI
ncbi:MAG: molybdopterin-binding protein [Mariniblastus sp.]|nr:molybdopterin-binding protein [Mariniblastus sp.]